MGKLIRVMIVSGFAVVCVSALGNNEAERCAQARESCEVQSCEAQCVSEHGTDDEWEVFGCLCTDCKAEIACLEKVNCVDIGWDHYCAAFTR